MEKEGVIKYRLDFQERLVDLSQDQLLQLNLARSRLIRLGMLGQCQGRYEGYGFGNISIRDGNSNRFYISGSQTGDLTNLEISHCAKVLEAHSEENHILAEGLTKPSSESLTHAVLYTLSTNIRSVVHVHCPEIWRNYADLGLYYTKLSTPYGTPMMAQEVRELGAKLLDGESPFGFVMLGHEDGVIAAAGDIAEATAWLAKVQARAIQII